MERVHKVDEFRRVYLTHDVAGVEPYCKRYVPSDFIRAGEFVNRPSSRYIPKDRNCLSRRGSEKYNYAKATQLLVIG
jgi:hypothetical protein